MDFNRQTGVDNLEPVPTGADRFGEWLTVQEAVVYCTNKGLPRTAKTVRRWAMRSAASLSSEAEIITKKLDTENGFRWLIEQKSLDVKIEQELEFERKKAESALVDTPVEASSTGADRVTDVQAQVSSANRSEHIEEVSGHGKDRSAPVQDSAIVEFLKKQLEVKDTQIAAMLERDRETNILIQGLQTSLTGVVNALPGNRAGDQQAIPWQSPCQNGRAPDLPDRACQTGGNPLPKRQPNPASLAYYIDR